MDVDWYLHETLMREQKLDVQRRAELGRLLRTRHSRTETTSTAERLWRLLRRRARPAPTLVPQPKSR